MNLTINFEQLLTYLEEHIGALIGSSKWQIIDQTLINKFAQLSQDFNFIHTCPIEAKNTKFGGTIAHGFLSLSLLSKFAKEALPRFDESYLVLNYGFDKIRFMQYIKVGSRIRANFTLNKYDSRLSECIFIYYDVIIEIENCKKPALKARWIMAITKIN